MLRRGNGLAIRQQFSASVRPKTPRLAYSGLVAIPVACLAALAVMPNSPSSPGDLVLPAWLLAAGLLTAMIADVIFNGIPAMFRAEHLVAVGMIVIIIPELLQPSYVTTQTIDVIRMTFIMIALFGTAVSLGSSFNRGRLPSSIITLASRQYSSRAMIGVIICCWGIAMFSYVAASNFSPTAIVDGLVADRFDAPWSRGQLGDWGAFRDFLIYFGYPLPTFTVLLQQREKSWIRPKVLLGLLCSASFLPFPAQAGGRRVIVLILGAALLTWLCSNRHHLKVRHYVAFTTISVVIVIALDAMLTQRSTGFGEFKYTLNDFTGVHVDNNFETLADTINIFPADVDYLRFGFIWYVIVRPVPRVIWADKPIDGGFDLAAYHGWRSVSLSNTIVGELYMSYGWFAVIAGGVLMGWAARTWSHILDAANTATGLAVYSLGTMCLFIGIRSMIELVLMSYPILCWWALDWGVCPKVKSQARHQQLQHF